MSAASDALLRWQADPYVRAWPESEPFWRAAADGRLVLPRCRKCGEHHWHPRVLCPLCGADDLEWVSSAGLGTVYSYSVVRAPAGAYLLAYVRLDEGPVLLTNVVECGLDELAIDDRVGVRFRATDEGRAVPVFVRVQPPEASR